MKYQIHIHFVCVFNLIYIISKLIADAALLHPFIKHSTTSLEEVSN